MATRNLPPDFLTITPTPEQFAEQQSFLANRPQQQQQQPRHTQQPLQNTVVPPSERFGVMTVFIRDAILLKNYGLTRMDPYVELKIGEKIVRSSTHFSGGKHPVWNQLVHFTIRPGYTFAQVEIFDECIATSNKSIASAVIDLEEVFVHNKISRSFELVGKQPHEGTINLDFTYMHGAVIQPSSIFINGSGGLYDPLFPPMEVTTIPTVIMPQQQPQQQPYFPGQIPPNAAPYPQQYQQQQQQQQQQQLPQQQPPQPSPQSQAQLQQQAKELHGMFPNLEEEVIMSILVSNNGNADATLTILLEMNEAHVEESLT